MFENSTLLNSQKADIFYLIGQNHIGPHEFEWLDIKSKCNRPWKVSSINHKNSGHYLVYDRTVHSGSMFEEEYTEATLYGSPAENKRNFSVKFPLDDWEIQLNATDAWLKCLKKEITTPDPWKMLRTVQEYVGSFAGWGLENSPFTVQEKSLISEKLDYLKNFLLETNSDDQRRMELIENSIDDLVVSSKTLGRKDWLLMTVGVLASFGIGYYFSPSMADSGTMRDFADLVKDLINSLSIIPPPQIR